MKQNLESLAALSQEITACTRCPRLTAYRQELATAKRRAYRHEEYWGRPLPGFGDPMARLLVVGLAPAAHGGNRTGRMFTGDSSADWLFRALHAYGFANQPTSLHKDDGLQVIGAFITAACRCAPPQNKPSVAELATCRPYLQRELALLPHLGAVLALGRVAFESSLKLLAPDLRPRPLFIHGGRYELGEAGPVLFSSYHPSRQNTQTGRLTQEMFHSVFSEVQRHLLNLGRGVTGF